MGERQPERARYMLVCPTRPRPSRMAGKSAAGERTLFSFVISQYFELYHTKQNFFQFTRQGVEGIMG